MTVKNKIKNTGRQNFDITGISILILCFFILISTACKVSYGFNNVSIPPEIKTVRVNYIDNKARYTNSRLSPELTDKLRQKIVNQTKLTQITSDKADYDITGYVSQYDVSTSGLSDQKVATNRLTVAVNITLTDNKTGKEPQNFTVSRNFDFSATLTLQQAEQRLNDEMIRSLTDDIFNRIFSNWGE